MSMKKCFLTRLLLNWKSNKELKTVKLLGYNGLFFCFFSSWGYVAIASIKHSQKNFVRSIDKLSEW